ncbi:Formylglycine-generating enzyme, required for sulfatase activity, contains SUMF1/FGE domain [Cyclobacterium lianum]|uniref:Formylglycine-generating enzyme, required for sulfatase activity, contains SUMF1/FGE domain n=2 Tax=Cyclobacterium lianum TaxID=388280 RepID=A0A1M7Q5K3_9BACT|nr:Formylglycine-generating enzyme, required for sulfatase activity, contains SUMF1/FGE domain [Cyclobacterium lianum]
MQFEKIPAGSMIAGRLVLQCPEPPDDRRVPVEERWTEEDYQRCQTLAARDSRPGFRVAIDRDFYIGKFEVTQSQWQQVMGVNPAFFQRENIGEDTGNYPVENVTWEDVQVFISRLNKLDGTATYRLPTEFEWEYAARAGAESPLSWQETRLQAWIQDSDQGSTRAVGEMKPNAWGLYDMLGNVWEWVADFHNGKTLPDSRPPKRGLVHVLKGGSFTSDVVNATWYFHGGGPGNGFDVGFRLVMEPI